MAKFAIGSCSLWLGFALNGVNLYEDPVKQLVYLAFYYFELQFASLVDHKKIIFDVYIIDYTKGVHEKQKHGCVLGPIDGGVARPLEWGWCLGCDEKRWPT